jgi:antitoxin ParD1/3/4
MTSLNVSLPEPLKKYIERQTRQGGYSTPSEYMRDLIRADQRQKARDRVEALLLEGLESGPATEMTDDDWADIRNEGLSRMKKRPSESRRR